jgi:hypothetical protein
VGGAEKERVAHKLGRRHACRRRAEHCLGDHQADVVSKAVAQAAPPMRSFRARRRRCRHPDVAVENAHRAQRHVIGP